jgi:hypothetical protein
MSTRTKHAKQTDIFDNVEYLQVYKNKKPALLLEDKEINGRTKTEIQKLVGERLGSGHFRTSIKYFGEGKNASGSIVAIVQGAQSKQPDSEFDHSLISNLENKLERLSDVVSKNSGVDLNGLMLLKDQSYKIQIDFFKERIEQLQTDNKNLKDQIKNLESESGSDTSGLIAQLLPILLKGKDG